MAEKNVGIFGQCRKTVKNLNRWSHHAYDLVVDLLNEFAKKLVAKKGCKKYSANKIKLINNEGWFFWRLHI